MGWLAREPRTIVVQPTTLCDLDCSYCYLPARHHCKILGAKFAGGKWANVVFDGCKIEYVTFDSIRANAPVVFVNTAFSEVTFEGCDLPGGHMSGCQLRKVEFVGGGYHGFDLRHNDLSTIRGAANLEGAVVAPGQRQELAEALVSELDLHYVDEGDR